jgi:hypothetical protein
MKPGDLVRSRERIFTNSEGYAGERATINVFPELTLCSSNGKLFPHQFGIILEISLVDVKILVPESGVIGWVSAGWLEVVSETG